MPKRYSISMRQLLGRLRPGMDVFVAGCAGESAILLDALRENPECAAGVRFTGVQIPTVNTFCYADLTPSTRQRCFFLSAELRAAFTTGRVEFLPLTYTAIWRLLAETPFDMVLFQGRTDAASVSLSIAADFTLAALTHARFSACLDNSALPFIGAARPLTALDALIDAPCKPLHYDAGGLSDALITLGGVIAEVIPEGACLQFGLGKLQKSVLGALQQHQNLTVHSGMVSEGLLDLLDAGALAPPNKAAPPITTGVALGSAALYARVADAALVRFMPVEFTHSAATLAALKRFVSVNSFIEIDLTGQVNAEMLDGKQLSGGGGMADFVLGARLANGHSILATPATANGGTVSRIRTLLAPGTPVTVPRHEVDSVATEFGLVRLRGLSIDQRANALISIAAPQFRTALSEEWQRFRAAL
jgi:acyl-CoA hydrolase